MAAISACIGAVMSFLGRPVEMGALAGRGWLTAGTATAEDDEEMS